VKVIGHVRAKIWHMAETQDELFDRLVDHYQAQQRVVERGGDFAREQNPRLTRRAFIRYGSGAFGLLEIQTVAIVPFPGIKRQISWTRNARFDPSYVAPSGEDGGSRMTSIATWDEALAAIDGPQPSP